ncbi:class I SAM-dependent methyltransferase [Neobacillus kokaensis]|uniref:SAM-dependent methyltransferase n=1 Tax=Neobacillus kokaensis TaxID=2759023 RepID=A0ABQ3N729_9BACI|nr:rRNA adenine N-6-methyltransferase family protein [Neobacillus kokaensis]GHI00749.1 SAM-dependent methyltransferase [Neobacillus kokaensis]
MQIVTFLNEFVKHPRNTGAIAPSSRKLAKKMVDVIHFNNAKTIVELGPGTGSFTKEIMKRKQKDTLFILIEINETFVRRLQQEYANDPSVHVVHGSAENIKNYLAELNVAAADYVLSGLPFTSLPFEVSKQILQNVRDSLTVSGKFITFQYSLVKKTFIQKYFPSIRAKKVWLNLPPAYVLSCNI